MSLRKPSELFEKKIVREELSSPAKKYLNDTYQQFQGTLSNIENLQKRIDEIHTEYPKTFQLLADEVSNRVTKSDLDNVMYSQLEVVDRNYKEIQEKIKGVNKKDLREFKNNVAQLTEIVNNLIDVELPQYKNKVTGNEIKLSDKLTESEKKVDEELSKFAFFLEEKVDEFGETKKDLLKITETYKKLHTVVSNKYTEDNKKIEEYSNVLEDFNNKVNSFTDEIKSDVANIKDDVIVYEKHVEKNIDRIEGYIQDNKKDLIDLKENVIKDITNVLSGDVQNNIKRLEEKINDIREKYDAIKPEEIIQDIQEGLLTISPDEKNSDPLTPLDQNYVTTKQLQDHYRLFLNRVQQQLSTLGGGGETRLQYLDDIVGIATNAAVYDGKFLSYDSSIGKFEFKTAGGGIAGISTTGTSFFNQLSVTGVSTFSGIVSVTSSSTSNSARNISISTISPSGGSDGDLWFTYTA